MKNKTLSYARITKLITSIEAKELIKKPEKKSFIKSFFASDIKTKHYADIWHEIESLLNIILWEAKHKKKNYIPFIINEVKNINIIEIDFDFNKIDHKQNYRKLNDIATTKIDEYSPINLKKSKTQESIIYFTLSFLKMPNDIVNIVPTHNLFLICEEIGRSKNGFKNFLNFIQIINIAINYINNEKHTRGIKK
jgi:hypothetical protein